MNTKALRFRNIVVLSWLIAGSLIALGFYTHAFP
jgi:hypothetical protein